MNAVYRKSHEHGVGYLRGHNLLHICGYNILHPLEARVNIRVQTTGDPAVEVLKDACHDLMLMCEHTRSTFDQALAKFKSEKGMKAMKLGKK
ncbi:hypothetical protein DM860_000084 [Cuscuta australis]|uniref:DNA-directed RNA polymerase RBP11-like dimerisation domain-containing protein n=1 Tax=Cuscuta australis TaxID=267555 RepID=A0A328CXJ7_9ASTE|nr:hypothetical protein DM860_000084 [Cuscuta australis]